MRLSGSIVRAVGQSRAGILEIQILTSMITVGMQVIQVQLPVKLVKRRPMNGA